MFIKIFLNGLQNVARRTNNDHHFQESLLNRIYRQIELAGRTCYKSEDKITNDSAKQFVDMLISKVILQC